MRERGLKHYIYTYKYVLKEVAPRAGAWIETPVRYLRLRLKMSLPVRERGLKLSFSQTFLFQETVAPRAGAWIETQVLVQSEVQPYCRSPCGSVD